MPQPAELSLEGVLREWEDYCLAREISLRQGINMGFLSSPANPDWRHFAHLKPKPVNGVVFSEPTQDDLRTATKWREYRSVLLDNRIDRLKYEDWVWEGPNYYRKFPHQLGLSFLDTFPLEFFDWTRKSRRVFSIPELEQEMFVRATMPEITWGDIIWPFESFVIELAKGIVFKSDTVTGPEPYVCTHVLVSTMWYEEYGKAGRLIHIRALNSGEAALFQRNERKQILESIERQDFRVVGEIADRLQERWKPMGQGMMAFPLYSTTRDDSNAPVRLDEEGFLLRMETDDKSEFSILLREYDKPTRRFIGDLSRIVVGTCLYLESFAPSFPSLPDKRRRMGRKYIGPLGILTDEVDVCRITGHSTFDPSRYDLPQLEQVGQGFVKPHWRRRHRRRPAFTPIDHPKTIIVPPKLINAKYVPLFGILAGSTTRMLSAEEEFE